MVKSKVLIIKTGGTIAQKPDERGILFPSKDEYFHLIKGLKELADFDVLDLGSIDSTNMETNIVFGELGNEEDRKRDRVAVAQAIFDNALKYDGFVVIHGTDTMAETAAALTYMIQDFKKPIVLTGSQRSIWEHRTDAANNVYIAVQAATMDIGEVVIAFGNFVLRGTRAIKISEESFDAFATPDVEPIGTVTALKEGIRLKEHRVRRGDSNPKLFIDFDTKIFHYSHISGSFVDEDLEYIGQSKNNHAILMGSYGAGNVPDRLKKFILTAVDNGKPVFGTSAEPIPGSAPSWRE